MTNHFTTPEFADLLKRHGIEIPTVFAHTKIGNSYGFILGLNGNWFFTDLADLSFYDSDYMKETHPAYLLSQVLGWLPSYIEAMSIGRGKLKLTPQLRTFRKDRDLVWCYQNDIEIVGNLPIEQLITQGLTDGWLTKEIIEQAIKHNQ